MIFKHTNYTWVYCSLAGHGCLSALSCFSLIGLAVNRLRLSERPSFLLFPPFQQNLGSKERSLEVYFEVCSPKLFSCRKGDPSNLCKYPRKHVPPPPAMRSVHPPQKHSAIVCGDLSSSECITGRVNLVFKLTSLTAVQLISFWNVFLLRRYTYCFLLNFWRLRSGQICHFQLVTLLIRILWSWESFLGHLLASGLSKKIVTKKSLKILWWIFKALWWILSFSKCMLNFSRL